MDRAALEALIASEPALLEERNYVQTQLLELTEQIGELEAELADGAESDRRKTILAVLDGVTRRAEYLETRERGLTSRLQLLGKAKRSIETLPILPPEATNGPSRRWRLRGVCDRARRAARGVDYAKHARAEGEFIARMVEKYPSQVFAKRPDPDTLRRDVFDAVERARATFGELLALAGEIVAVYPEGSALFAREDVANLAARPIAEIVETHALTSQLENLAVQLDVMWDVLDRLLSDD